MVVCFLSEVAGRSRFFYLDSLGSILILLHLLMKNVPGNFFESHSSQQSVGAG